MRSIALATEDELSEAIGLRLLSEWDVLSKSEPQCLRKNGFGYLRSKMGSWKQMATRQNVLILTDLDQKNCPIALLDDWLGPKRICPQNLLLRIAVKEIESWILADHEAMRQLIGRRGQLPLAPDELPDPKQYLLALARHAPRNIREDLVAQRNAVASQGLGYNRRLADLVQRIWSPQRAAERSPSLSRARCSLARMVETL